MIAAFVAALAVAAAQDAQAQPAAEPEQPAIVKALVAAGVDPKTTVRDGAVQVMFGQRAVLRLDQGKPVLEAVEIGRIDKVASAKDDKAFKGIGAGKLAFALDASTEKRQSMMKVWNGLARPIAIETEIVAVRSGKLMKKKEAVCAVAAGGAAYETWPDPIIAVSVSGLGEPPADAPACSNEKD
jgi:hypothetical protein